MTKQNIPLVGYADRLSVTPGESISFKVSSTSASAYDARLVRVVSCDPNPDGPGITEHSMEASFTGSYPSRTQSVHLGSYLKIHNTEILDDLGSFTLYATIWSTTPNRGLQGILSRYDPGKKRGFALAIKEDGAMALLGNQYISVGKPLIERRWYRIWVTYDVSTTTLTVGQIPLRKKFDADDEGTATAMGFKPSNIRTFLLTGAIGGVPVSGHFSGKIERPTVIGAVSANPSPDQLHPQTLACWDFAQEISTKETVDIGPNGLHGELVNLPTRAVMSSTWNGATFSWE